MFLSLPLGIYLVTQINNLTFRPILIPNPIVIQPTSGLGIKARF